MVKLGLTMNSDVKVGGADIVAVDVRLDVEVEAHPWRVKPEGPNLPAVILGRKGRCIVLWENSGSGIMADGCHGIMIIVSKNRQNNNNVGPKCPQILG